MRSTRFSKLNSIFFLCFLLLSSASKAQYNSPFSRFGLGNKIDNSPINQRGMGSSGIADNAGNIVNNLNPALFSSIKYTTLQFAINGYANSIETNSASTSAGKVDLSYLQLGMPISKSTGLSFGLMSDYQTRYTLRSVGTVQGSDTTFKNYFNGKGNLSKVYLGIGQNYKNFSVGVSAAYLFGNTIHVIDKIYDDTYANNFYFQDSTHYGGIALHLGALYEAKLNAKYKLNVGLTYTPQASLKSTAYSYNAGYSSSLVSAYAYDTIYNSVQTSSKTILPSNIGLGISLANGSNWRLNADFNSTNLSQFRDHGSIDSVNNAWMANVGFAFIPDPKSFQNSWKANEYRVGAFYGKDYIKVGGDVSVIGFAIGTGVPFKRTLKSFGQVNASLQFGKRGSLATNKVSETFFRFGLGLTFNDKWFIKRKYD